jgi:hypothetical protein
MSIDLYADPEGNHTERASRRLLATRHTREWRGLRRWAHMLGFGGHFLTNSHRHRVTFRLLREARTAWQRTVNTTGPEVDDQTPKQETVLVVNFLQFVGAGWHTTGDAMLANATADLARCGHRAGTALAY